MPSMNRAALMKAAQLKQEKFTIGDGYVCLRELSSQLLLQLQEGVGKDKLSDLRLLAHAIVDDEGKQLFADAEDVKANLDVGCSVISAMVDKVLTLSGIRGDDPKP